MERLVSVLLALLLLVTGAAYALHVDRAADAPAPEQEGTREHAHDAVASDRDARLQRASSGRVPTDLDVVGLERYGTLAFARDTPWTPASGVVRGDGSAEDPYLIEGVYASVLYIADTSVDFEIRNSYIERLVLDWHGANGLVHHNRILSLQTNRNVERIGGPSAAVIVHNVIDEVTQLRHFDGVVAHNVIGKEITDLDDVLLGDASRRLAAALDGRSVVFDIAGFNGAEIRDNVVYGGVDIKVHGHHHDDGNGGSHNHGAPDAAQGEASPEDHAARHHRLDFHDNVIVDPFGFGLRYNDLNHAGDDRTATSEQEPTLEGPHTHWTHVAIRDNVVDGAPIRIEVFMAPDEYHRGGRGEMEISGNRVLNATTRDGILLGAVRDADVLVERNVLVKATSAARSSGVRAVAFENATLTVRDNAIEGFHYGVSAREFDANTTWSVEGNRIVGAARDVHWDETVANAPRDGGDDGHAHEHGAVEAARSRFAL